MLSSPLTVVLISCLAFFLSLKIEATCSSETSKDIQRTTLRYITEERSLETYSNRQQIALSIKQCKPITLKDS
jgi:hypothetical protein